MSPLILHNSTIIVAIGDGIGGDAMLTHLTQHLYSQNWLGVESTKLHHHPVTYLKDTEHSHNETDDNNN